MNYSILEKRIIDILFRTVFLVLAGVVVVKIMETPGNILAKFCYFLMLIGAAFSIASPRRGFLVLILATAFLDYFKRLLILAGNVDMHDIYWVLGIAPALICGVFTGCFWRRLQKLTEPRPGDLKIAVISLLLGLFVAAGTYLTGAGTENRSVSAAVNAAVYVITIFALPVLFRDEISMRKLIRFVIYVFMIVGAYAWYHGLFGLTDYEIRYLKTGLSIEVRQLYEGDVVRPFSTMNSAANLSTMMSIMAATVLLGWRRNNGRSVNLLLRLLFFAFFAIAAYFTVSRGGWFCGVGMLVAYFCFRSKPLTIIAYVVGFASLVTFYLSSTYLLESHSMASIQDYIEPESYSNREGRAMTLGTFNDRLISMSNLTTESDMWTPFGTVVAGEKDLEHKYLIHDTLTYAIIHFGYVPVALGMLILLSLLWKLHRFLLSCRDPNRRQLALLATAGAFGIACGSVANSAQLQTYPISFYFYFFIGIIISCRMIEIENERAEKKTIAIEAEDETAEESGARAPVPLRVR